MSLIEIVAQAKKVYDLLGKDDEKLFAHLPEEEKLLAPAILKLEHQRINEPLLQNLIQTLILVCKIQASEKLPPDFEADIQKLTLSAKATFPASKWPFRVYSLPIDAEYENFIKLIREFVSVITWEVLEEEQKGDFSIKLREKDNALSAAQAELAKLKNQLELTQMQLGAAQAAERTALGHLNESKAELVKTKTYIKKLQNPKLIECMILQMELEMSYHSYLDANRSVIDKEVAEVIENIFNKLKNYFVLVLQGGISAEYKELPVNELDQLLKINYRRSPDILFKMGLFPETQRLPASQRNFYRIAKRLSDAIQSGKLSHIPALSSDELLEYHQTLQGLVEETARIPEKATEMAFI